MNFNSTQEIATDSIRKRTSFLLYTTENVKGLAFLEPRPLHKPDLEAVLGEISSLKHIYSNDRWQSYHNDKLTLDITFPATEKEIANASSASKMAQRMVSESPQLYQTKVRPFLEASPDRQPPSWIKNILDGKSEQERILFLDENFIILPDSKWAVTDHRAEASISSLYLLALFRNENLKTIRDLSSKEHLLLLKELRSILTVVLKEKFNLEYTQVRPYFHYQPSFYLLHLHIPIVSLEYPGAIVGRSHLLDDVIENMEAFDVNFYSSKKTLFYPVNPIVDPDFYNLFS